MAMSRSLGSDVVDDRCRRCAIVPPEIVFKPRDHPQQGGLAAAGRPDQHNEFAIGNVDADTVDDRQRTIILCNVLDGDVSHMSSSIAAVRSAS